MVEGLVWKRNIKCFLICKPGLQSYEMSCITKVFLMRAFPFLDSVLFKTIRHSGNGIFKKRGEYFF